MIEEGGSGFLSYGGDVGRLPTDDQIEVLF